MNKYLSKPFPFIEKRNHRLLASIFLSGFILVFLYVFQPFGMSEIEHNKALFISGYSLITLLISLFCFFVLPCVFKNFFDFDKWTLGKFMLYTLVFFLIMTPLNWIYNSTVGKEIIQQKSLFYFLFSTIAVGITPTIFLLLLIEKFLARKNEKFASTITDKINKTDRNNESTNISILSKNKNENIELELNDLLCIKADGNYLMVFYRHEKNVKSKLIRNSIANIEEQLNTYSNIKRCHRSFLVNLENVKKVTGNARNLSLYISNLEFTIPVSRSFPQEHFNAFNT